MVAKRIFGHSGKQRNVWHPAHGSLWGKRQLFFSAYGCPDGLEELTARVYYSDFAQQIIKNAAVSNWNYNWIYF